MLALAEILALLILNALLHAAFGRWKVQRRTRRPARVSRVRRPLHYPLHPSPAPATHVRPSGIDW